MKKTILLSVAFIAILGLASIFYNAYQSNDPSSLGPSGMYSQIQEEDNSSSNSISSDETPSDSQTSNTSDTIPALDFMVYNTAQEPVKLSDFYGKPIVVNFWATWCGPCKSELPAFEHLYAEYGDDVVFMMVNLTDGAQETVSGVTKFITENNYHFPVYFDTDMDATMTYSVYSIPATLFIDADGNIVSSHLGAMSEASLRNYIEKCFK